jgi:predicted signal transduction protein with EAL and GGDEF domain
VLPHSRDGRPPFTQTGRPFVKVRIDQLALLFALVVAANLVLLAALELPRLGRRLGSAESNGMGAPQTDGGRGAIEARAGPGAAAPAHQRVARVASFSFIGAAMVVVALSGTRDATGVIALLGLSAFVVVLFQDVLPAEGRGPRRMLIEAGAVIGFLTVLVALTDGHTSPFFFGYVLLLVAAGLWGSGAGPAVLTVIASASYLAAVVAASGETPLSSTDIGRVAFNLVALALVTYVASVVGHEHRRARDEALRLSRFDSLTGLHSRDFFMAELESEIRRASRNSRPFALLMIDLDGLKAANDRFGHAAGDQLIRAVAEVLRGAIRASDVAARYGGDEFVVMLPETDLALGSPASAGWPGAR